MRDNLRCFNISYLDKINVLKTQIINMTTSTLFKRLSCVAMLAGATLLTGCATPYVDTATREVPVADYKKPAQPKLVKLNFEFQTKGVPNGRATEFLKSQVNEQLLSSGLFTAAPADANADLVNVTLNNVPVDGQNPAMKGFVTGLTFGLAGSAVTDGYVCTINYLPAGSSTAVTGTARHAIHTTVGNATPPQNAEKSPSMEAAVRKMTRDVVSSALLDLSNAPGFN